MILSVGNKHFIESEYIFQILKAEDYWAEASTHTPTSNARLINATGGKRTRSVVKLKSRHIVLSSLKAKTLKLRLGNATLASEGGNSDKPKHKRKKKSPESEPPEFDDRRKEPDRRRFSYTHHIPERRSGTERRSNNGKLQHER